MIQLLYVTTKDDAQAKVLARLLVEEGLATCANILPGMSAIYRWEGKIEEASEALLILKTTDALAERAITRIRALHSYETPCVLTLPVVGGNPDYLAWLVTP